MGEDQRPVVTITDPHRPALSQGAEAVEQRPPRVAPVPALAGALALLLVVGTCAAVVQHRDQTRAEERAQQALDAITVPAGVLTTSEDGQQLQARYRPTGSAALALDTVTGAGWHAELVSTDVLLTHATDCGTPVAAAPSVTLTASLAGRRRTLPVTLDPGFLETLDELRQTACGGQPSGEALQAGAEEARQEGDGLRVALELGNLGTRDLVVTDLAVDGLTVRASTSLPLTLHGRPAGPRGSSDDLRLTSVDLRLTLQECLAVGQVLNGAPGDTGAVQVTVGNGHDTAVRSVQVPQLAQSYAALVLQRCRR